MRATARPVGRSGPRAIPVLPVRDNVHFPGLTTTVLASREVSVHALQAALRADRLVLAAAQKHPQTEEPSGSDLFELGTLSEVVQVLPMPDGTMRAVLRGISRARTQAVAKRRQCLVAQYAVLPELDGQGLALEALCRESVDLFRRIAAFDINLPTEVVQSVAATEPAGAQCDAIAHYVGLKLADKQALLEELDVAQRLNRLHAVLMRELQLLSMQAELRMRAEQELGETHRVYLLREQLKAIREELRRSEGAALDEFEEYRARIMAANMPAQAQERAMQELERLERSPDQGPDSALIRNYLDWLIALPWSNESDEQVDLRLAAEILDREHHGLSKVKDRVLDFLAVRQLSPGLRGPILCLVGPPGVGKTSIGRSIARSLGRKFAHISLGGVRDEGEIRGHRRTYVGALPGRIMQALRACGTRNPVLMLDEVDKLGCDVRGDPTHALLEALDPEQNGHFSDHYIELPFDLSRVLFLATANLFEAIPAPLRDRLETIAFAGYSEDEKVEIANGHLLPKALAEHGLKPGQLRLTPSGLRSVIRNYTREAGVRALERELAAICRKAARRIASGEDKRLAVGRASLPEWLGPPRPAWSAARERDEVGAASGLVYTEVGGDLVTIEVSLTDPYGPEPRLILTGNLGDVMKESAMAATTYVRSNQAKFCAAREFRFDTHVHVPQGAVPKDGPSAGLTIAVALASAFSNRPVRRDVAFTGEISLRGAVIQVGGVREKLLAAHRAGIRTVVLPRANFADLDEVPLDVRSSLDIRAVDRIEEAISIALRA